MFPRSVQPRRTAVLMLCLLAACGGGEAAAPTSGDVAGEAPAAVDLRLEPRRVERIQEDCTRQEGDTACTRIILEYPAVTGESPAVPVVRRWIEAHLLATLGEGGTAADTEAMVKDFLEENRAFREEFPDAPGTWAVERKITVLFQNPRILSLVAEDYSYTGGAHPLMVEILGSFDLQQGHPLVLADLLKPGFEEPVTALAEAELRRVREIAPEADLVAEGFFLEDGFRLTDNFAVVADGLRFYYNPYDIGPYVMGSTDLTIPLTALQPWIAEDSPLGSLR